LKEKQKNSPQRHKDTEKKKSKGGAIEIQYTEPFFNLLCVFVPLWLVFIYFDYSTA